MELLERFLNYVKIPTQSKEDETVNPTTKKQFVLAKMLESELKELGLINVELTNNCIVYGYLPSNAQSDINIGFIAHMDTSPEASDKNIKPQIIKNYDGSIIKLKQNITIDPKDFPRLNDQIGNTLITTDGTTLLGADDKAGVAEIMNMLEYFINNPNVKHHGICVAFTPDEEVGMGTDSFDIKRFNANFAYTVDGGKYDEFSYECFNASSVKINIKGVGIHPGEAKDKMVNAIRIAMELDSMLPSNMRPEYTDKYDGFNHITHFNGDEVNTDISYIIRNHDINILNKQKEDFKNAVAFLKKKYPKAKITLTIKDSYFNMRYDIEGHKEVIDLALDAMKEEDVTPIIEPIRGGTDGARLTSLGLPTPNMPTGGYNYHGVREYASFDEMIKCSKYLINIAKIK